jgi:hypothetical protein
MSKPQEQKEYKVKIIVTDEMGVELERNYNYEAGATNFNEVIDDMIDTHEEAQNL